MKKSILITILILGTIGFTLHKLNDIFVVAPRVASAQKELKTMSVKDEYVQCKLFALQDYDNTWDDTCMKQGLGKDCMLDQDVAQIYNKTLEVKKNTCLEIYKIDMGAI